MASFVSVPKDLNKIKSKVALRMTKRQLICFGAAALIGIPAYLFTRAGIGNTSALLLMMALMAPLFLLAMYERDGLPAEKIIRNFLRAKFFWPQVRHYRTDNFYTKLMNDEVTGLEQNRKKSAAAVRPQYSGGKSKSKGTAKRTEKQ